MSQERSSSLLKAVEALKSQMERQALTREMITPMERYQEHFESTLWNAALTGSTIKMPWARDWVRNRQT